ncbi:MAG: cytochrome c [Deltaproteobacteria bacterium]|nr:cytochrome c [Deltaproteobacteria bacterium]
MNRPVLMTRLTILTAMALFALSACTREMDAARKAELAMIVQGGLMYDNWFITLGKEAPKSTKFAYSSSGGKAQGADSWRCKECHGWDYLGKEPDYSSGNHFSGFPGIQNAINVSELSVLNNLKNTNHRYGEILSDQELKPLVAFLMKGQLEMRDHIDRGSKKAKGDSGAGKALYQKHCTSCHGDDGKKLKLGEEAQSRSLGAIAVEDPWKTLHKIRFGQPGKEAPSLLGAPVEQQVDVLAYAQTLPVR